MTTRATASEARIAIVTGANRGIGFETCRQLGRLGYRVILTSREAAKGRAAAEALHREGAEVIHHPLDVTKAGDIARLRRFVLTKFGRVHVLINNAGVLLDEERSVLDVKLETLRTTMETNVYGALQLCQAFVPVMRERNYGRVVNVSSGMGQLAAFDEYSMSDDSPAYRMSKAALNALTRMVAAAAAETNVLVNSVCPGWVRTDMGGPTAPRSVTEGADTIVWLATLPDRGPTGGFFRDRRPIPW